MSPGMARTENNPNKTVCYDSDGYINKSYYINAISDIIDRSARDRDRDPNRLTTNQFNAGLGKARNALFIQDTNPLMKIPYTPENITRLIDIYLELCRDYDALPSLDGFQLLTGMDDRTADQYVTPASNTIRKARKAYIQNRLNNNIIGVMSLANNDIDTGLLYTRQNIVAHEVVKRSLSFDDLQRIAQQAPGNSDQG